MKRVEIIIPDRKLRDANEVIRDANTGGMSYYRIEGRGGIAQRIKLNINFFLQF